MQAVVDHDVLAGGDAAITGGTFVLRSKVRHVVGAILSGEIEALPTTSECGRETFHVTGTLAPAGSGNGFDVLLTHYRYQMPSGPCITYFVTVRGTATFTP